jgi:hypothetical protein
MVQAFARVGGAPGQIEVDSIRLQIFSDNEQEIIIIIYYQYSTHVCSFSRAALSALKDRGQPVPALYKNVNQIDSHRDVSQRVKNRF